MTDPKNEVLFCEYCKTCKHKLCDCEDEPCCDCLAAPVNYYSHKPVLWEGVDTLFNKPAERRNHEVERAVKEALCLDCGDVADVLEAGSTPRTKINKNVILSEIAQMVKDKYGRDFKWEELTGLLKMFLSYDDQIMEMHADYYNSSRNTIYGGLTGEYVNGTITNIQWHGYSVYGSSAATPGYYHNIFDEVTSVYLPNVRSVGYHAFSGCDRLSNVYIPSAEEIYVRAFEKCSSLISIDLPNVKEIENFAFTYCNKLETIRAPQMETLGSSVFENDSCLKSVFFPCVKSIGSAAFRKCTSLVTIDMPNLETMDYWAFSGCSSLTTVNLPNLTSVTGNSFSECPSLTSIYLPALKTINFIQTDVQGLFKRCTNLKNIDLPSLERASDVRIFEGCSSLTTVNLPKVRVMSQYGFKDCTSLTEISLPNIEIIGNNVFQGCTQLKTVMLPRINTIRNNVFDGCKSLELIDLSGLSTMPNAIDVKAFTDIPATCLIKVPVALYIKFIAHEAVTSIKNQVIYTGEAQHIQTTITNGHMALDGVSNSYIDNDFIIEKGFSGFAVFYPDDNLTIIEARDNNNDILSDLTYTPSKPIVANHQVTSVSGAKYGFALRSNGYYESENKAINSSAAVCRIIFNCSADISVILKVINSGENNYDYGILSIVDDPFTTDNNVPAIVHWTGKGKNSNTAVDVPYTIPAGEHFIDIKYRKDGSGNSGNDSLQFKVVIPDNLYTDAFYTYTIENVQEDHNINVVFGEAETSET